MQWVLADLEGHFPKFSPLGGLRIWDENKRKAFVIQTPWNRPGLLFPIRVVCYLMGTEGEAQQSHSSPAHSTFLGIVLGKVSLCELSRWTHPVEQVMENGAGRQLPSGKS